LVDLFFVGTLSAQTLNAGSGQVRPFAQLSAPSIGRNSAAIKDAKSLYRAEPEAGSR
jgi:hypothetical protein